MNKIKYSLLLISCLFIAFSCTSEADLVDLPKFEKKLVIQCYISPSDTEIIANVDYNISVFNDSSKYYYKPDLKGVKIYLSDGEKQAQFTNVDNRYFSLDPKLIPIIEGRTYYLEAKDTTGNIVTSKCTIPIFSDICFKIDTSYSYRNETWDRWDTTINGTVEVSGVIKSIHYELYFNDTKKQNYKYRLLPFMNYYIDNKPYPTYYLKDIYFWDGPNKDTVYKAFFDSYTWNYEKYEVDSVELRLQFLQLSTEYYSYYNSIDNYNGIDSYFSELSPVYTNIKGGLGIFCGYAQRVYTFKINKDMVEYK
jgi:hypothetical protein